MKFKKLMALTLAAFLTVGSVPMDSVRAAELDPEAALELTDEAALELSVNEEGEMGDSTDIIEGEDSAASEEPGTSFVGEKEDEASIEEVVPTVEDESLFGSDPTKITLYGNGGFFRRWDDEERDYIYDVESIETEPDQFLTEDDQEPRRDGYWFTGWYDGPDTDNANYLSVDGSRFMLKVTPNAGDKLYAGWSQDQCTVTFDLGNDATYRGELSDYKSVSSVQVSVLKGTGLGDTINSIRYNLKYKDPHYSLLGWTAVMGYPDNRINESSYKVYSDQSLYAVYATDGRVLTYHANGGYYVGDYNDTLQAYEKLDVYHRQIYSSATSIYITSDIPKNDDPRKAFTGWFTDATCNTPVEKYKDYACTEVWDGTGTYYYIKTPNGDVDLYAGWADTNVMLILDSNDGENAYFKDYNDPEPVAQRQFGGAAGSEFSESVFNPKHKDKHKKFTGWYTDQACTTPYTNVEIDDYSSYITFTYPQDTNTTLYAGWEDAYHVVTVEAGDGYFDYYDNDLNKSFENVHTASFRVKRDGTLDGGPNEVRINDDHKQFDAWYVGDTRIENIYEYSFTKDTTVVAHYKDCYVVTINYNGGYYKEWNGEEDVPCYDPMVIKVPVGESLGYIRDAYYGDNSRVYGGWYLSADVNHTSQIDKYEFIPEGDCELVAFWAKVFTVTFDAVTGTFEDGAYTRTYHVVEGSAIIYSDEADIPEDPDFDADDWVFGGWTLSGKKVERDDILYAKVTEDMTYVAEYVSAYTIVFNPNGGSFASRTPNYQGTKYKIKVATGESMRGKVPTVKSADAEHVAFSGWYENAACEKGDLVDPYTAVFSGTKELYAGWVECYKLTFHANYTGAKFANGTSTQVVKVVKGTAFRYGEDYGEDPDKKDVVFAAPEVVNPGDGLYVVPGWYTNANCTGDRYVFTTNEHFVEYDEGDYTYRTYYDNMYGFIPTEDMEFYAKITDKTVEVKFNINDGTARFDDDATEYIYNSKYASVFNGECTIWTVTVPKGIRFGEIGEPYNFEYETTEGRSYRWAYDESECTHAVEFDRIIDKDTEVFCMWYTSGGSGGGGEGVEDQITYHAGEGYFNPDDRSDKTTRYYYNYGSTDWQNTPMPLIDDETRAFEGWYYDEELERPYPAEYQMTRYRWGDYSYEALFPEKVDHLYAKYGTAYTIVFDANGGYFDEDYDRTKDPGQSMRETTKVKGKVYPGQSIMISDYTKRVRRDGNKIMDGWYTSAECRDDQKVAVYAIDSHSELFRPVGGNITLYAKWIDYEAVDTVTASVEGKSEYTIDIGQTIDLSANIVPKVEGTDISADAHWFISGYSCGSHNTTDENPVKLYIDGKATGMAEGTCWVYAIVNGVRSDELKINVSNNTVESSIVLRDSNNKPFNEAQELYVGDGFIIKGVIDPAETADDLAQAVTWESTNTSVAQVTRTGDGRDATVIAVGEGEATITASLGKSSASVDVVVINPVDISPKQLILTASESASREITASVIEGATNIEIKAYDSEECENESALVSLTQGSETTSSGKKNILLTVAPTAEGLNITDTQTITIRASVVVGSKSYSAKSTLTLNPPSQVGAVIASVGKAYESAQITNETAVTKGTKILLNCETRGTDIYYTTNGSNPVIGAEGTQLFENAIVITGNTTIKAFAVRSGMNPGKVYTFLYKIEDWGDVESYRGTFFENASEIPAGIWYVIGDTMYPEVGNGATTFAKQYTGSKITFNDEIKVYAGTSRLYENRDYTISYANNTNAAGIDAVKGTKRIAPTVTIKGKGNYTKTATFRFTIETARILMCEPANGGIEFVAAGTKLSAIKPVLKYKGKKMTAGKDFVMSFFNTYNGSEYIGEVTDPSAVTLKLGDSYYIRIDGKEGGNFAPNDPQALLIRCVDKKNTVTANKLKLVDANGKPLKLEYTGTQVHIKDLLTPDASGVAKAYVADGKIKLPYDTNPETACYSIYEYDGVFDYVSAGQQMVGIFCSDTKYEGKTYFGSAALTFEITGVPMKSVKIAGLSTNAEYNMGAPMTMADLFNAKDKTVVAQKWTGVTLYTTATVGTGKDKKTVYNVLEEGNDYYVTWENNTGIVGKCYLTITGKGRYSGQIKKTINVKAYNLNDVKKGAGSKIVVSASDAHYSKAGAKPAVTVTFGGKTLREGIDYTVAYKKNTKLCENYTALKESARPTVTVKGKGNFTGSNATAYFNIHKANIATDVDMVLSDVVMDTKSSSMFKYFSIPKFLDNGKALSSKKNTDIDMISGVCYYAEDTVLLDGTRKYAGDYINSFDMIPNGTLAMEEVTVTIYPAAKGSKVRTKESMYYVDDPGNSVTLTGYYRLLEEGKDIGKMTASIKKGVTYTYQGGDAVIPVKTEDILVSYKVKGQKDPVYLTSSDFEIVSVSNNRFLGTATVVIQGKGQYGGTKSLTFKIMAGSF